MGRESQACRRPEPEEKLLFPICDSAPRDTGDPSKSALGAGGEGVIHSYQAVGGGSEGGDGGAGGGSYQ